MVNRKLTLEAASKDISLNPRGKEFTITKINNVNSEDSYTLIDKVHESLLNDVIVDSQIILLDENNKIITILENEKNIKSYYEYMIVATGTKIYEVKDNFNINDIVKLRLDGEISDIKEVIKEFSLEEQLVIKSENFITTINNNIDINIVTTNLDNSKDYKLIVDGTERDIKSKTINVKLIIGVNYIDINLIKENENIITKTVIVYRRKNEITLKENILWLDQFPSALKLNSVSDMERILKQVKELGFTACSIDVKGPEGYSSYKKNDLTNSPYFSEIKVPHKKGMNSERDFFQDFIDISRKYGLKVYAAINVMTEGNLIANDHPLIDKNPEWEEIIQRPEDDGELVPVRKSKANNILLYINPANSEAISYEIRRFEEVIKNYDIDGVVLDRCRYDNKFADFSDVTKVKFSEYLASKGKELKTWPEDVFKINNDGSLIEGEHYLEWWTFRSSIINNIAKSIRKIVDKYSDEKAKKIELASYVGSWYEIIYENGINWSSKDFRYDKRLGFSEERIYNKEYYETSYIDNLDFIMIGTYYQTEKEVSKYITLGNILINESIPMLAGMSIPDLKSSEIEKAVYSTAIKNCEGTMTFDLSYINFN